MTYNEIIYMVLDEMKVSSDDSYFTPDHIKFLLGKYRSFLLKQRYSDIRKIIPESNYQSICLDLEKVHMLDKDSCNNLPYLRSIKPIPTTMKIGAPKVYPLDYYQGEITYVDRDRMKYTGYNRFLQNIIYCSQHPDTHLYFKSSNPQFLHLEQVKFSAVFEDAEAASELSCDEEEKACDILDRKFPIEEALVAPLIEIIVGKLREVLYAPKDEHNDAHDDTGTMTTGK